MNPFKTISDSIRANLHALLDNTEEPVKLLNKYLQHMQNDIAEAERAVAKQIAKVKRLKLSYEETFVFISKKEVQALEALKRGEEALAREALEEKKMYTAMAKEIFTRYTSSQNAAKKLKTQLNEMKAEYDKLCMNRDSLAARYKTDQAQDTLYTAPDNRDYLKYHIEHIEEKILQMKNGKKYSATNLDKSDIDREIEQLKHKLGMD